MLQPAISKDDKLANWLIGTVSVVVFVVVVLLGRVEWKVDLGFDPHLFARVNAVVNSMVAVLLLAGLIAIKQRKYVLHKKLMFAAMILSIVFLVSYICHHLFAGDTKFGGEGSIRYLYFIILISHIFLAAIILPFILYTAYRALVAEFPRHKKLAKITWPIWFYVAITGVIVYFMISPYYQ